MGISTTPFKRPERYSFHPSEVFCLFTIPVADMAARLWAARIYETNELMLEPESPEYTGLFIASLRGVAGLRLLIKRIRHCPYKVNSLCFCTTNYTVIKWGERYADYINNTPGNTATPRFLVTRTGEKGAQFFKLCAPISSQRVNPT